VGLNTQLELGFLVLCLCTCCKELKIGLNEEFLRLKLILKVRFSVFEDMLFVLYFFIVQLWLDLGESCSVWVYSCF